MAATETTTNTDQQLAALQQGAGIYPLDDRAFLRITGSDATRWLNGMVTNNIKDLAPGEGNYNFLLNNQGRIQADCTIYREPGDEATYLLETSADQIEAIQQHLDKFIIMDDVELTREPAIVGRLGHGMALIGPQAPTLIRQFLSSINDSDRPKHLLPPKADTETYAQVFDSSKVSFWSILIHGPASPHGLVIVLAPPSQTPRRYDLWFQYAEDHTLIRERFEADGAIDLSNGTQHALRILNAQPLYGQDIRDRDLPQETAQTHALHFSKGCYLGQEIVERIHSRGQVHRTFTQFNLTGSMPQLPAIIESNGKPVGELTSAAPINGQLLALGYLRREAFTQALTYPGGSATQTPRPASNSSH